MVASVSPDEVGRLAPAGAEDQRDVVARRARPVGDHRCRGPGHVEGVGRGVGKVGHGRLLAHGGSVQMHRARAAPVGRRFSALTGSGGTLPR